MDDLDLHVYSSPNIPLQGLEDLYASLGHGQRVVYLLERVLYLVGRDEAHERIEPKIREAEALRLLSEVTPLSISQEVLSRPVVPQSYVLPWQDPHQDGKLDLTGVLAGSASTPSPLVRCFRTRGRNRDYVEGRPGIRRFMLYWKPLP